jgi:hypothetical protein
LNDGIEADIIANEPNFGEDFAYRKIHRKSEVYKQSNQREVDIVYLITENDDTAKEMYKKCGFKKAIKLLLGSSYLILLDFQEMSQLLT